MTSSKNGPSAQSNSSWQNEYLKKVLHEGIVKVKFVKRDGSERDMICTLKADLLPQTDLEEQIEKKKPNPDALAVWDVEKGAWRSFRYDSIIGFSEKYNGNS